MTSVPLPTGRARVALVGCGPGAADLLTLRAIRRLAEADVVLYDHLVDPDVLAFAPGAEHVFVGKIGGGRRVPQASTNRLLLERARKGERVVRLKGGDPFVFGRGGEEAAYLREHGVAVEVVPGVSSALAAPAVAGVPVTHRGVSASVSIVTAMAAPDAAHELESEWLHLARSRGTLVVLMGLRRLEHIVSTLLEGGIEPDRPAAVVSAATTASQQVVRATLATLVERTRDASLRPPATVVVGDVVALGEMLDGVVAAAASAPAPLSHASSSLR